VDIEEHSRVCKRALSTSSEGEGSDGQGFLRVLGLWSSLGMPATLVLLVLLVPLVLLAMLAMLVMVAKGRRHMNNLTSEA
jgi:hypothetical protein